MNLQRLAAAAAALVLVRCAGAELAPNAPIAAAETKQNEKLLYIGDWSTNDVFVYDYVSGRLLGTLTGFDEPYGMCVDAKGDVYVANFGAREALEFARGSSGPVKTFHAKGEPQGCAVDARGDVAVVSYEPGEVVIFQRGRSRGTVYRDRACFYMSPGAYDDRGNFYAAGSDGSTLSVCELPEGATRLKRVSVTGGSFVLGPTLWDGKYVVLSGGSAGSGGQLFLQATEQRSGNLAIVGRTTLSDNCEGGLVSVRPFIVGGGNSPVNRVQANAIVGANWYCNVHGAPEFNYWKYPGGGFPFKRLNQSAVQPFGEAVSIGT